MSAPAPHPCCQILELRRYTLVPGGRARLAALFEHHFLDAHDDLGMHVPGLFADHRDPDRLLWLRGFPDLADRFRALSDFYLHGPVWRAHSGAANATMVDSDDVLLLRPAYVGPGYPRPSAPRLTGPRGGPGLLVVDVMDLDRIERAPWSGPDWADAVVELAHVEGAEVLLVATTHPGPNDFVALPVRDERVGAWLVRYPDLAARERLRARLGADEADEQVRLTALAGSQIG